MPKILTITHIGMNDNDYSVLKVAARLLQTHLSNDIEIKLSTELNEGGGLLLIDMDANSGENFYTRHKPFNLQETLLLSSKTLNEPRTTLVRKPVRVQSLKDALNDAYVAFQRRGLVTTPAANAQAAGLASQPLKTLVTQPLQQWLGTGGKANTPINTTLLNALLKAKQDKQILHLTYQSGQLSVHGKQEIIVSSISSEKLRQEIVQKQSFLVTVELLAEADFEHLSRGQILVPFKNILWLSALHGSPDALIAGKSITTPFRLKAWPNFSRLYFTSEYMQIAAALTNQPMNVATVAEQFKIPIVTVISFYNALWAMDLLQEVSDIPEKVKQVSTNPPASHSKQSLFTKIAKRLGWKNSNTE